MDAQDKEDMLMEHLFHKLWTKDVGKEGYVKSEWTQLFNYMQRLKTDLKQEKKKQCRTLSR